VVNEKDREPYHFQVLNAYDADIEYCELLLKAKIKEGVDPGIWGAGYYKTALLLASRYGHAENQK